MPKVRQDLEMLFPITITGVTAIVSKNGCINSEEVCLDQERPQGTIGYEVHRCIVGAETLYVAVRGKMDKNFMMLISSTEKVHPSYITH